MNRFLTTLALLGLATPAAPAYIGSPVTAGPLHIRVGAADLIVIATVMDVELKPSRPLHAAAPTQPKELYVGTLRISEVIHGDKSLKSVQAAAPFYYVTIDYEKILKGRKDIPVKHAPALKTYKKGREGLFFLQWSPVHKLYLLAHDPLFVAKDDPVYGAELERTRYFARLLADPKAYLRGKDERDRTATAALLIYRYRWPRVWGNAEAPIAAEESRLILGALRQARWELHPKDIRGVQTNLCFYLLGQPGWLRTKEYVSEASQVEWAKKWLARNRGTFRIKKLVWDPQTGTAKATLHEHTERVTGVAFSRAGKRLVSTSADQTVRVWDVAGGKEILTLKGHTSTVGRAAFTPDGKRLVSGGMDGTLKVWDAQTGREIRTFQGPAEGVSCLALSPDGKRVVTNSDSRNLKVWDLESGRPTLTLKGHQNVVLSAAFSPDGKRLASGSHDKLVKVWDAQTGQEILSLRGHRMNPFGATGGIRGVAFSPDGKTLVSGGDDKTVRLWDARTGQETATLKGHGGWVRGVAFSPDGKRLVSGSADKTLKLWDVRTGREILTLNGHSSPVSGVAFSPDGKHLASSCGDPLIRIWDANTGK